MATTSGIGGGVIDVNSMVKQLMDIERQPATAMQQRKATSQLAADAVGRLRNSVESLRSSASNLLVTGFGKFSATSSNVAAATATASTTATPGSLSFTVDRLASAFGTRTAVGVAANTSTITSQSVLALSTTTGALGIGTVQASNSVAPATYTVAVTQASTAAVRTGTAVLGTSTTISGGSTAMDLSVDGVNRTINIAAGTYTPAGAVAALQAGLDAAGAAVTAGLDASGRVTLTSTRQGSAATLQVTNQNAALGFTVDAQPTTGVDGVVSVNGSAVTVTSAGRSGDTATVAAGGGTFTLDLSKGLRVGTATIAAVSTGDRSLTSVVNAINASAVGATAAAVKLGDGSWVLQANSSATGTAAALAIDQSAFVGGLVQTSAAQDAKITIGSGPGAYSLTAAGNTFSDVLPGVTVQATAVSSTPVQINVSRNTAAIADAMESFVRTVNSTLADINLQTKYDPVTKKGSPLTANATVKRLADDVRRALGSVVPGVGSGSPSQAGISVQKDGSIAFDRTKFTAALESDPAFVQRLMGRGGTATSSNVAFSAATDATKAGTYDVVVTQAATQAQTGTLLSGVPAYRTVAVRAGTVTATYQIGPSDTANDVAAGLNAALRASGVAIDATVSGLGVNLTASAYGSKGTFSVNTDVTGGGSFTTYSGNDLAGTIDGQPAIGSGTTLRMVDVGSLGVRGLELTIAPGVSGALGTVSYNPGIAARTQLLGASALTGTGALATAKSTYDSRVTLYAAQIDRFELRMVQKEAGLRRQWSSVQGVLSTLTAQSNWLASKTSA
ncbi:MAG: flagellar filament capping protein FliD [Ilumatobacteraceae bacterium]